MSTDLLKLVAQRDLTKLTGRGSSLLRLLKPMGFEMSSAQALIIKMRRQSMRELFEMELRDQILELKSRNMMLQTNACRYRWTPLGMMPVRHKAKIV